MSSDDEDNEWTYGNKRKRNAKMFMEDDSDDSTDEHKYDNYLNDIVDTNNGYLEPQRKPRKFLKSSTSSKKTVAFVTSNRTETDSVDFLTKNEFEEESDNSKKFGEIIESLQNSKTNTEFRDLLNQPVGGAKDLEKRELAPMKVLQPIPSDMGAWQKHTKGIGLKLLQKFGFTGRLGAREDGIARPVDVVHRPTGEGLGFTEMSNKKPKPDSKSSSNASDSKGGLVQSREKRLVSEEIADARSWRKGKADKIKPKLLDVSQLLNAGERSTAAGPDNSQVILDMRGEEVRVLNSMDDVQQREVSATSSAAVPKLGQELLYNMNLVVEHSEAEARAASRKISIEVKTMESCKKDMAILQAEIARDQPTLGRLEKLRDAMIKIDSKRNTDPSAISLDAIVKALASLHGAFPEEFCLFGIVNLLPNLANPIMQAVVKDWDPILDPMRIVEVVMELSPLVQCFKDRIAAILENQAQTIIENLIERYFVPPIRRCISNEWDPQQPEHCVRLVEILKSVLPTAAMAPIFEMLIIPKLTNSINGWNISKTKDGVPMHTWLHPWLPLIGKELVPLFPDVRRKLGQALKSWHASDEGAMALVTPWLKVFDTSSMHNLLIRSVVPKLVEALREVEPCVNSQDKGIFDSVMKWHSVVPMLHFASVLEGEFFPKWLGFLSRILANPSNFDDARSWYLYWKQRIPTMLLETEERLRYPLYVALEMMNEALRLNMLDNVISLPQNWDAETSYFNVLEARKMELNMTEKSAILQQKPFKLSFKELVELFAEENGVIFIPQEGRSHEGKQLYLFGTCNLYLHQDVVFVRSSGSSEFEPVSLQMLSNYAH